MNVISVCLPVARGKMTTRALPARFAQGDSDTALHLSRISSLQDLLQSGGIPIIEKATGQHVPFAGLSQRDQYLVGVYLVGNIKPDGRPSLYLSGHPLVPTAFNRERPVWMSQQEQEIEAEKDTQAFCNVTGLWRHSDEAWDYHEGALRTQAQKEIKHLDMYNEFLTDMDCPETKYPLLESLDRCLDVYDIRLPEFRP